MNVSNRTATEDFSRISQISWGHKCSTIFEGFVAITLKEECFTFAIVKSILYST